MAIQMAKRRFNVDEYYRMADVGIFHEDSNVELLDGVVWEMHPPKKHKYTVEEYNLMIEGGVLEEDDRVELIKGEIVEMSPIGKRHQACVDTLAELLHDYAGKSVIVRGQGPIQLPDYSQPQPDIALLRRRGDYYRDNLPVPADVLLIVEVAETSLKYDRDVKAPMYAKAGICELWLIDLKNEVIEVYTKPEKGKYGVMKRATRGETIMIEGLSGLALDVNDILG